MNKQFLSIAVLSAAVLAATTACSGQASNPTAAGLGGADGGAGTTTSASASAGASPSASPSQTAGQTAAAPSLRPSSAAPAATGPAGPTAASTTAAAGDADWNSVPTTWLSPARVPLHSILRWTGGGASTVVSGAGVLSQTPIAYPCEAADRTTPMYYINTAKQYSTNYFSAPSGQPGTFNGVDAAMQSYTLFADDDAARAAFQEITQDVASCDQQISSTVNTKLPGTAIATKTVTTSNTLAYTFIQRDSKGNPAQVDGNYSDSSDYHGYVVLDRNLIDIVWLRGGPSIDPTGGDASALNTIADALG